MDQSITTTSTYKAALAYEQFLVSSVFRYWTPVLLQRAAPQTGEQVLDVACGTGVVARSVVPLVGPEGRVVGLDINPSMLEVACKQVSDDCGGIDWQDGQAENLPFEGDQFDLVLCQQGLQYFTNRPKAVVEMNRVLRRGGRVGIAVWQSLDANPFYKQVFEVISAAYGVSLTDLSAPFSFGHPKVLGSLLARASFRQVVVEDVRQDVHFHTVDHFLQLTIKSIGAVVPAFARLDSIARVELQARATQLLSGMIEAHTQAGVLTFPMRANIATGVK